MFKLVIFPLHHPYMDAVLADLKGLENVYFEKPLRNGLINKIRYFHTSITANRFLRLPFQSLWYSTYFKCSSKTESKFAFLFFQGNPLGYDSKFHNYLRKKYPSSKLCFFWGNMVSDALVKYVDYVNREFDLVYTFDKNDHLKYGWHLHEATFGDVTKWNLPIIPASDIFFVGKAKGRIQLIHDVYDKFEKLGYKADFHVIDVDSEDQVKEGIIYNQPMSYYEVLGHSLSTKVILEIVQEGQVGTTLRTSESIAFKKRLLTNNIGIKDTYLFSPHVTLFKNAEDIKVNEVMNSTIDEEAFKDISYKMGSQRLLEKIQKDYDEQERKGSI